MKSGRPCKECGEDMFWAEGEDSASCNPDYENDLNACAEVERDLNDDQKIAYQKLIQRQVELKSYLFNWITAKPKIRAECLLKVLEGQG